jgi:hypothetical protein
MIIRLMDVKVHTEVQTNKGRVDAVVMTEKYIYVMEFKMGDGAEALAQIKENGYHEKYKGSSKVVMLIGVGFDAELRNIKNFTAEEIH